MTELAKAIMAVAKLDRPGTELVMRESLQVLHLAQGHHVSKWAGTHSAKNGLWAFLLKMQTKWPHQKVFPDGETFSDVAHSHEGEPAPELGFAHLMGGVGISLPVEERWDADRLTLVQEQLVDEDDVGIVTTEVELRHVASREHAEKHRPWIREQAEAALRGDLISIRTGAELWERCADLFPHLLFLPHVETQLRQLKQYWVHPVRKRLTEMERAVLVWDAATQPDGPQWESKVTPEHSGRKRDYCKFIDLDGTEQYFDTHLRFTPGVGRLHFRFLKETRRVHIAHIGFKLGE
ncbi:hypothetical protein OG818_12040 [Streptomyces virginiae]|uniref:hypothetical protein n=1 Tax=Streptomyces virginiae TaxID=1961 RepID=UPI002251C6D5|nr:hypothetical protein [Streptomyces virginiae]MCX4716531.1 hypothetical protein [Streptomyces virginiae]